MKHLIIDSGEGLGIASHIAHARTLEHKPIIIVGAEEEKERGISINEGLPQLVQNIIESAETYSLTQYQELTTPLSGREKRRERRKQNRKK
jgi:hypothetical protein